MVWKKSIHTDVYGQRIENTTNYFLYVGNVGHASSHTSDALVIWQPKSVRPTGETTTENACLHIRSRDIVRVTVPVCMLLVGKHFKMRRKHGNL